MPVCAIAAMDEGRAIGKDNDLLWDIPEDMKHFVALTKGGAVLMGRKTFQSLKRKPLPHRRNIVVSRNPDSLLEYPTVEILSDFIPLLKEFNARPEKLWIIGGGMIYQETLPYWDEVYLTHVPGKRIADTYFPSFEEKFELVERREGDACTYLTYRRIT